MAHGHRAPCLAFSFVSISIPLEISGQQRMQDLGNLTTVLQGKETKRRRILAITVE